MRNAGLEEAQAGEMSITSDMQSSQFSALRSGAKGVSASPSQTFLFTGSEPDLTNLLGDALSPQENYVWHVLKQTVDSFQSY